MASIRPRSPSPSASIRWRLCPPRHAGGLGRRCGQGLRRGARPAAPRLRRHAARRRWPCHPRCRRLGGAGTRLCARHRRAVLADAGGGRPASGRGGAGAVRRALGRCRPVPLDRQGPRHAQALGAARDGLRPCALPSRPPCRDGLAHAHPRRPGRELAAHHHRGLRRRCRRRGSRRGRALDAAIGLPDAFAAASPATPSSSSSRNRTSTALPIPPPAPAAWRR